MSTWYFVSRSLTIFLYIISHFPKFSLQFDALLLSSKIVASHHYKLTFGWNQIIENECEMKIKIQNGDKSCQLDISFHAASPIVLYIISYFPKFSLKFDCCFLQRLLPVIIRGAVNKDTGLFGNNSQIVLGKHWLLVFLPINAVQAFSQFT